MRIRILGSGAGGGFPQWNCNCANCRAVRAGESGFLPRTQSSLAASANGHDWVLLNASPDLRRQIEQNPELAPSGNDPVRASPIKAVVVTNGDVDHVTGLLTLREAQPFTVYGSARVLEVLAQNRIFNVLSPSCVERRELPLDTPIALKGAGADLGLSVEAFPVLGKIALWLEDALKANFGSVEGDTLGLKITESESGKAFFYIPGCAGVDTALASRLRGAALVFFDGTLWRENEMIEQGLLGKTGTRMGHINMSGPDGSIAAFAPLGVARKIYVHINNSNPALNAFSKERREAEAAGWAVGEDAMEVLL